MIGYDQDGQELLDQELVIARADRDNIEVYRIGHHRSDEDQFDYYGEPHAVISPTGTRVLFGSDWSGADDGQSVDSYVVELPAFSATSTLPVSLSSFTGRVLDDRNQLSWTTASEEDTEHHILQRSADGATAWTEVARTRGAGWSRIERSYSLSDIEPLPTAYYRLLIRNFDGSEQRSSLIYLEREPRFDIALTARPNPAKAFT